MSKITNTDGSEYTFIDICDCGLTGGCNKCNPLRSFWKEDVKMAEDGIGEYREELERIDREMCSLHKINLKELLSEDLILFYKKKGYK